MCCFLYKKYVYVFYIKNGIYAIFVLLQVIYNLDFKCFWVRMSAKLALKDWSISHLILPRPLYPLPLTIYSSYTHQIPNTYYLHSLHHSLAPNTTTLPSTLAHTANTPTQPSRSSTSREKVLERLSRIHGATTIGYSDHKSNRISPSSVDSLFLSS